MKLQIDSTKTEIKFELNEAGKSLSFDIQTNKSEIEDVHQCQTDKNTELENQMIKLEINERKRNLLVYGVQVDQSRENEDTDAVFRALLHKYL